jgi:hypothetical protein
VLVDVPLVIKLPKGFSRDLAIERGRRVANIRVGPTLIEAAGGTPEPGTAASLFQQFDKGLLSELYLGNGVNRFSLVNGDLQLLWESRFGPPEPEYYRARYEGIGGKPEPPLTEPARAIFDRLAAEFASALPLTGRRGSPPPQLTLVRWTANGTQRISDPGEVNRMARQLKNSWLAANGAETAPGSAAGKQPHLTPRQEEELRSLGYAVGGQ